MKATASTTLRWLKMVHYVKNCQNNSCICADKLRRLYLTIPLSDKEEKILEQNIEKQTAKYQICFNKNIK
tara:strand:+ start:275 stop:484 length:210 start_codon:yes stop_codon:yes gene_type:complete